MFKKILIANRGEIARRVIRTCKQMGITTVAVHSQIDGNMPYVKEADEAYCIGASAAAESYLNSANIIEVAKASGADAIHPGYGFLSESHLFAKDCSKAGIVFIGPKPEVIEILGDKLKALKIAKNAKIPTLKSSEGAIYKKSGESTEDYNMRVEKIAQSIGYPIMIKPQGGGGGIGMRVVHSQEILLRAIEDCRLRAQEAFGNPGIYLEQCLEGASHIEVQILGDESGRIVHLFDRDCSVQRRNQKIIEESPAKKLSEEERLLILRYALRMARRVKKELGVPYTNAGTVEFLVSSNGDIRFIEINTRLQVEHGVTEMITGKDLVELQIRIAAGEEIPFKQSDIEKSGHAIEARVYPEIWDWNTGQFMPQSGVIGVENLPCVNEIDVRVDSALDVGDSYDISLDYEPLIMKVICRGKNRKEACAKLLEVLEGRVSITGVQTNIPFIRKIIESQRFSSGEYDTKILDDKEISRQFAIESEKIRIDILTHNLWKHAGTLS